MGFSEYKNIADRIRSRCKTEPKVGIILGTSLGAVADDIEVEAEINYSDIPGFLKSTVSGHAGKLIFGRLKGVPVVCMSGRFHYYEGYDEIRLSMPVRIMKLLGVKHLIITNAAGAVNEKFSPGELMVINDHINFMGVSPLRGNYIPEFGPRFFDMTDVYSKELLDIEKSLRNKSSLKIHDGTYGYWMGPSYETPAEIRAFRILGADAVGMSTVTESTTAASCGIKCLAMSLITNMAAGITKRKISAEEVEETASVAASALRLHIGNIVERMGDL